MQDCATKIGKIVKTKRKTAYVEMIKNSACNGCKACAFGASKKLVLPANNDLGATVGDTAVVALPPEKPVFSFVMLYALPLLTLLIGLFVTSAITDKSLFIALGALVGLVVGFTAIFIPDKLYFSKKYSLRVIDIINTQGETKND